MIINIEAWKTMDAQASLAIETVLSGIATAGNIESIAEAIEAGVPNARTDLASVDRLNAALRLVDYPLEINRRTQADALLKRWMALVPQSVLDDTLFKIADNTEVRPDSCRMLTAAGADPYKVMAKTKDCALTAVFHRSEENTLLMLQGIFGNDPITDPAQLPRTIPYENNDKKLERWNLLEYASILGHFQTTTWLTSRIDGDTPARKLLLDLGDAALGRLFLEKTGDPEKRMGTISIENCYLPDGLGMLIGGAKFMNPAMWKRIAARPTSTAPKDPYIFEIVKNPRLVGWNTVPGHVERLVDTLIKHDAVPVDMFNSDGKTLLMVACERAEAGLVKVLLDHGADPYLQTTNPRNKKSNAIELAKSFCNDDVVQMLEAAGARKAVNQVLAKARKAVPGVA